MYSIVDFFIRGFHSIVRILNFQFFEDFPVTFLQLILASIVISVIFKFVFGGYKEANFITNGTSIDLFNNVSKSISNKNRKKQVINENKESRL